MWDQLDPYVFNPKNHFHINGVIGEFLKGFHILKPGHDKVIISYPGPQIDTTKSARS